MQLFTATLLAPRPCVVHDIQESFLYPCATVAPQFFSMWMPARLRGYEADSLTCHWLRSERKPKESERAETMLGTKNLLARSL